LGRVPTPFLTEQVAQRPARTTARTREPDAGASGAGWQPALQRVTAQPLIRLSSARHRRAHTRAGRRSVRGGLAARAPTRNRSSAHPLNLCAATPRASVRGGLAARAPTSNRSSAQSLNLCAAPPERPGRAGSPRSNSVGATTPGAAGRPRRSRGRPSVGGTRSLLPQADRGAAEGDLRLWRVPTPFLTEQVAQRPARPAHTRKPDARASGAG
jgi:hypothetical protein